MNRMMLALLALTLCSTPAAAQTRARYGIALYDVPKGWSREEKSDVLTFTAPDKTATLIFAPSRPLAGSLDKAAEEVLAQARTKPEFREESKPAGGKHNNSGGQWLGMVYSYSDATRPGQFLYDWVVLFGGGGRYVVLTTVFKSMDAYKTHGPTLSGVVNQITLTTLTQVERGNPVLTRYMLDEVTDFLDWLMQVPLTDAQKATVEAEIRGYWQKNVRKEMDDIAEFLAGREQLAAMKPAEREVARQAILEEVVKQWRTEKDSPSAKMMMDIYDNSHKPIAAGNPPLTQQNVDAFAEFLCFAAGQTAGVTATPPAAMREKLAKEVAANYASLPNDQRELIARMPLIWASLRLLWPEMPEAERTQYIEGWKRSAPLVELGKQLKPPPAAATTSDFLRNQAALQAQQQSFQMMSNIMRMQHETNMIIIGNMGGNTRYEYRWR